MAWRTYLSLHTGSTVPCWNPEVSGVEEREGRSEVKKLLTRQAQALDVLTFSEDWRAFFPRSWFCVLATVEKKERGGWGVYIYVRVCGGRILKSGSCLQFLSLSVLRMTWPGALPLILHGLCWRWSGAGGGGGGGSQTKKKKKKTHMALTRSWETLYKTQGGRMQTFLKLGLSRPLNPVCVFTTEMRWLPWTATPVRNRTTSSLRNGPSCTGSPPPTPSVLQVNVPVETFALELFEISDFYVNLHSGCIIQIRPVSCDKSKQRCKLPSYVTDEDKEEIQAATASLAAP